MTFAFCAIITGVRDATNKKNKENASPPPTMGNFESKPATKYLDSPLHGIPSEDATVVMIGQRHQKKRSAAIVKVSLKGLDSACMRFLRYAFVDWDGNVHNEGTQNTWGAAHMPCYTAHGEHYIIFPVGCSVMRVWVDVCGGMTARAVLRNHGSGRTPWQTNEGGSRYIEVFEIRSGANDVDLHLAVEGTSLHTAITGVLDAALRAREPNGTKPSYQCWKESTHGPYPAPEVYDVWTVFNDLASKAPAVQLTEVGLFFRDRCTTLLEQLNELRADAAAWQTVVRGLKIFAAVAATATALCLWFPPAAIATIGVSGLAAAVSIATNVAHKVLCSSKLAAVYNVRVALDRLVAGLQKCFAHVEQHHLVVVAHPTAGPHSAVPLAIAGARGTAAVGRTTTEAASAVLRFLEAGGRQLQAAASATVAADVVEPLRILENVGIGFAVGGAAVAIVDSVYTMLTDTPAVAAVDAALRDLRMRIGDGAAEEGWAQTPHCTNPS